MNNGHIPIQIPSSLLIHIICLNIACSSYFSINYMIDDCRFV